MNALTVVVCTHNRAFFLEKCLNSLLMQTYSLTEFATIVVDNNSSDSTYDLASTYKSRFINLQIIQEPIQGLSYARNAALNIVQTEWVAFLDDDAVAEQNWVEIIFETIDKGDFDVFGGVYTAWHALRNQPPWFSEAWETNSGLAQNYSQLISGYPSGGNCVYKVDFVRMCGGFPVNLGMSGHKIAYGEETKLIDQIRKRGGRIGFVPDMIINHCVLEHKYSLIWRLMRRFALGRDEIFVWGGGIFITLSKSFLCILFHLFLFPILNLCKFLTKRSYYWQNFILDTLEPLLYNLGKVVGLWKKYV